MEAWAGFQPFLINSCCAGSPAASQAPSRKAGLGAGAVSRKHGCTARGGAREQAWTRSAPPPRDMVPRWVPSFTWDGQAVTFEMRVRHKKSCISGSGSSSSGRTSNYNVAAMVARVVEPSGPPTKFP